VREPAADQGQKPSFWSEFRAGLGFIAGHREIRFVVGAMVAGFLVLGAFDALASIYVRDVLARDSVIFGAIVSLIAAGTVLGSLLLARLGQGWSKVALVLLGLGGIGFWIFVLAALGGVPTALAASFLMGFFVAAVIVAAQTLIQEETPQAALGRVSSAAWSLVTFAQLAAFSAAGAVAGLIGIARLFQWIGVLMVAMGLGGHWYARRSLVVSRAPGRPLGPTPLTR